MKTTAMTGDSTRFRMCLLAALLGLQMMAASSVSAAVERIFSISPKESRVVLVVYREGVLSVLAHDHAMVAAEMFGAIRYDDEQIEKSSIRLSFPVGSILVDLPEERQRLNFTGELTEGDIRTIRKIMLSPRVLDAERFPTIEITSLAVRGALEKLTLDLKWRIRGVEQVLKTTAVVTVSGNVLRAKGEMDLFQTKFGIKPYSTLLGAIAVKDRIRVKFDLVAREVEN